MPRFLVSPESIRNQHFSIMGSEAHHAVHVLRKNVGDVIELFDGKDRSFHGKITSISADEVEGVLIEEKVLSSPSVSVVLYQGIPKGEKWDWVIEKNCEIGVSEVVPVLSMRTIVKWKPIDTSKLDRWNRIALAASKQCGRPDLMHVREPLPFFQALKEAADRGTVLIPWEKESSRTISQSLEGKRPAVISLFIGPEGGWDVVEVEQARAVGAIPVRLGSTLLRTETAGLVAATLVLREFGLY